MEYRRLEQPLLACVPSPWMQRNLPRTPLSTPPLTLMMYLKLLQSYWCAQVLVVLAPPLAESAESESQHLDHHLYPLFFALM